MYSIVLLPVVPLRLSHSETSEMVSQLLYGEIIEILETKDRWVQIRNLSDNYEGWVDRKMITLLSDEAYNELSLKETFKLKAPFQLITTINNQQVMLSGGSLIRQGLSVFHDNLTFQANSEILYTQKKYLGTDIVNVAIKYINAPYLWGGKTIFGIDCSGLVQVAFSCCGYQLPRDASQQIEYGNEINTLSDTLPGDVVFFKNENNRINHVGILTQQNEVIHASGWVKCEVINEIGIISKITGEYTHKLAGIRRIL